MDMSEVPDTLTQGFLRGLSIETLYAIEASLEEDEDLAGDPEEALSARDDLRLVRSFIAVRRHEAGL